MSIKLFVDLGSQPSRSVHWLLMLLKAPFELNALRLDKGETRTKEFLAINPFGKVPAIQLPSGESLIESNAILVFLCSQFDKNGVYYPKNNALERARVDAYLHFHHEFRNGCAGWFQSRIWKNEDAAAADKKLFSVLDKFESYWLGNHQFVQSKTFTIADMQAANELYQVIPFSPVLQNYPKTKAWLDRVKEIPHHEEMLKGWMKLVPLLEKKRSKL